MNSKQREELQRLSESFIVYPISHGFLSLNCKISLQEIKKIVDSVLAEPVRNCDVGTAEEQAKRFTYQFCRVGIDGCVRCKLNTLKHRGNTCGIHWAQMPYESEVTK